MMLSVTLAGVVVFTTQVARREAQELRSKVAQLAVELEQATSSVANANRESLIREALEKEVRFVQGRCCSLVVVMVWVPKR